MESQSRRDFIRTTAIIGAGISGLSLNTAEAAPKKTVSEDRMGVLVDTTVCVGCRNCEWACKKAHGLPTPPLDTYQDRSVFEQMRRPDDATVTVVNETARGNPGGSPVYVKVQCMHCDHPACVSACIVGAISKEEDGSVVWDTDKCIGCRYCMVACPFQVPSFDYSTALRPDIRKCDFCHERTQEGKVPACVEICPVEALTYGPRVELIKVARARIQSNPDRYVNHIYGEYEAGGTSWLYIANKDFRELGFPKLGNNPMPGTTESIQHGIFAYFVPPVLLYALLGALMWITKRRKESE